jgi:hypothetical protein
MNTLHEVQICVVIERLKGGARTEATALAGRLNVRETWLPTCFQRSCSSP